MFLCGMCWYNNTITLSTVDATILMQSIAGATKWSISSLEIIWSADVVIAGARLRRFFGAIDIIWLTICLVVSWCLFSIVCD